MAKWAGKGRSICVATLGWLVLSIMLTSHAFATKKVPDPAEELQSQGYFTDTPEQIKAATKDERPTVRFHALQLLMQRVGKEAVPTLKEALDDPTIDVRWRAAHLLGMLGDKSGLQRMRRDLEELERDLRLTDALYPAKVLAELGDASGYELAARMALEGQLTNQRQRAAWVLIEIAKLDEALLRQKGIDPAFVLRAMAESEEEPTVLWAVMTAHELENDVAVQVLEAIQDSLFASELHRRAAERLLLKVREKIEAAEPPWGEAVEGVQVRLRADKTTWVTGDRPTFEVLVRKVPGSEATVPRTQEHFGVEVDGLWYRSQAGGRVFRGGRLTVPSGRRPDYTRFGFAGEWQRVEGGAPLRLTSGKHLIRVAIEAIPKDGGQVLTVMSNPVEIAIQPLKDPTVGDAVEGVQVRLRADKTVWAHSEAPTFKVDVRNGGGARTA